MILLACTGLLGCIGTMVTVRRGSPVAVLDPKMGMIQHCRNMKQTCKRFMNGGNPPNRLQVPLGVKESHKGWCWTLVYKLTPVFCPACPLPKNYAASAKCQRPRRKCMLLHLQPYITRAEFSHLTGLPVCHHRHELKTMEFQRQLKPEFAKDSKKRIHFSFYPLWKCGRNQQLKSKLQSSYRLEWLS